MDTIKVEAIGTRFGIGKEIRFVKADGYQFPVADVPTEIGVLILKNNQMFREAKQKRKRSEVE